MINQSASLRTSAPIIPAQELTRPQAGISPRPQVSDRYEARMGVRAQSVSRAVPLAKESMAARLALRGALVAGIATVSFAGASGCIINTGPQEQVCNDTPKAEAPKTDDTSAEAAKPEEPNGFLVGATILGGGWLFLTLGAAALTFGRGNI